MKLGTITQQPAEKLSYTIDYVEALTVGDGVQNAGAASTPPGLTVDNVGPYDTRVKFWVSGGVSGVTYKITITTNTADGRTFQDELTMKIKEL